jgi:two-component system chemotaxis sensor kinase CheA
LILNPGSIAQNANVTLSSEADDGLDENRTGHHDFLLVETGNRRAALPLETVVRIERIPRSRIERAGSRPVLRFDGQLLPLDDAASELIDAGDDPEAQTTVVVCRDGDRHVGMTVSQVLDVTGGKQLEQAGTGGVAGGITLLHDRVTGIVSLSGIPSLECVAESPAMEDFQPAEEQR